MTFLEKDVVLGALQSGTKKDTNDNWYRVHYLDLINGTAHTDYFDNPVDFDNLVKKKVPIGTKCTGLFTGNSNNRLVLVGVK